MKEIFLSKRIRSLLWRTLMMFIAGLSSTIAKELELLSLSPELTVLLGLILGEISKAINNSLFVK